MLPTRFTDLVGCQVPVQLAGMSRIGTSALAAAVTNAGGLGMLPGASPPELRPELSAVAGTATGPFGVNFLIPFLDDEAVELAAAYARLVEFFHGEPDGSLVERVHRVGALAGWQVGSTEEARHAAGVGCDLVVAQGIEAGGHVRGRLPLLVVLDEVLEAVDVPVLAAGGIGTGRTLATVLAAGADGVRVGTRFVAAKESGAHPDYVRALVAAGSEDTVVTEAFALDWPDAPHRVLKSAVAALARWQDEVVAVRRDGEREVPLRRGDSTPPSQNVHGAVAATALYAGQSVGAVTRVEPAAAIVAELVEEAVSLLAGRPRG
jgi:nitronate monooxygenase